MADRLFRRVCRLTIDTKQFDSSSQLAEESIRVSFKVTKSIRGEPNTAIINVTNLNADSRKLAQTKGTQVMLEVGYLTASGTPQTEVLFQGELRLATQERQDTLWITKLEAGTGYAARKARVSKTFGKGAQRVDLVKHLADAMKVDAKDAIAKIQSDGLGAAPAALARAFSMDGNAAQQLEGLVAGAGYSCSNQDGTLQLLADINPKTGKPETTKDDVFLVSPSTGLEGSPEVGEDGLLRFKCRLSPGLSPGRGMLLQSAIYNGLFRVEKASYDGDTHGQVWTMNGEGRPL